MSPLNSPTFSIFTSVVYDQMKGKRKKEKKSVIWSSKLSTKLNAKLGKVPSDNVHFNVDGPGRRSLELVPVLGAGGNVGVLQDDGAAEERLRQLVLEGGRSRLPAVERELVEARCHGEVGHAVAFEHAPVVDVQVKYLGQAMN